MRKRLTILFLIFAVGNIYPQIGWFQQSSPLTTRLFYTDFVDSLVGWTVGLSLTTILKTTNGGNNWNVQNSPVANGLTACKFINYNTGWICGTGGVIIKTTNSGTNWFTQLSGISGDFWSIYFLDINTGWASTHNGKILKTINSGTNWTEYNISTSPTIGTIFFINSQTGWVVGGNYPISGSIYKSTNGGQNWSNLNAGSIPCCESCFFTDLNNGWVTCLNGIILKTTNGGNNWTSYNSGTTHSMMDIYFINSMTGWIVGGTESGSTSVGRIWKTTNAGINWISQYDSTLFTSVTFATENIGYAVGLHGGIFKTETAGEVTTSQSGWYKLQTGGINYDLWSVSIVDSLNYWTVGASGTYKEGIILRTTNGGTNWINQSSPVTNSLLACKFINTSTGWISGGNGLIIKTTNGGANWFTQSSGLTTELWALFFTDINTGWIGSHAGEILKTTNSGNNWTLKTTISGKTHSNFFFINSITGWLASGTYPTSGNVYKTTNGGTNWFVTNTGTISMTEDVCFVNENIGWVSGNNGMIIKTTDGGSSWFSQSSGTFLTLLKIFFVNQNTGWAVGSDNTYANGIILKTTNSGVNWITQFNTTPLYAVNFYNENVGSAVGRYGNVCKTLTGGEQIPIPFLISPLNGATQVSLTSSLTWDSISMVTGYKVMISTDSVFSNIIDSSSLTSTQYIIPSGKLNQGTRYYWRIAGYNTYGIGQWSTVWNFTTINNLTLNLKVYLEGFWNGIVHAPDTVRVYLASSTAPYTFADSSNVLLSTDGTGTFQFTKCENNNYYIVVTHRNHLETWSRFPKSFTANVAVSYNFTTAPTQAYGSNMIFSNGGYCIYGGDINQDGFIDGADMAILDNDLYNYVSGYVVADINGDQFVDGADMAILDNNLYNYIGSVRPGLTQLYIKNFQIKYKEDGNKSIRKNKENQERIINK